jgi:hypothetical protein
MLYKEIHNLSILPNIIMKIKLMTIYAGHAAHKMDQ